MARLVANAAMIPAGIERVPGTCERNPPGGARLLIKGMTVAAVLDKLVSLDSRYRWKDIHGVIVVRPVEAWDDPAHYLHETVESFDHADANIGKAWYATAERRSAVCPPQNQIGGACPAPSRAASASGESACLFVSEISALSACVLL